MDGRTYLWFTVKTDYQRRFRSSAQPFSRGVHQERGTGERRAEKGIDELEADALKFDADLHQIICTLSIVYSLNPDAIYARWSLDKCIRFYESGLKIRKDLSAIDTSALACCLFGGSSEGGEMVIDETTDPELIDKYYSAEFNPAAFPELKLVK